MQILIVVQACLTTLIAKYFVRCLFVADSLRHGVYALWPLIGADGNLPQCQDMIQGI